MNTLSQSWDSSAYAFLASLFGNPIFLAAVAGITGWIGRLLYDRYMMNLKYSQRIAQATIERVLGYTEKHYFPLSSRGFQLVSALNGALGSTDRSLKRDFVKMALYRMAQYLAVESRITRESGGLLLLKDFDVERTIGRLKVEIDKWLPIRLTDREYLAERGEMSFRAFEKLRDNRMRTVYGQLEKWVKDEQRVKSFCKQVVCQNEVIAYALGNVYRPWYRKKPPSISNKSREIIENLKVAS